MEILQLIYFKDAAETENFSKAAKKNMVPQPSISSAVKRLEQELGVTLFDRSGRKIYLNENGQFFYQKVSLILNTLDECTIYFSKQQKKELILYIQNGDFFMAPMAADFSTHYPNARIIYATVEQVMHSQKAPYDFTFMELMDDMNDFNYEIILEDELVALVSIHHPLSNYDTIDVSQLKNEKFIGLWDTIPMQAVINRFCQEYGLFTPDCIFRTHDNFATLYKVTQNEGVAILPEKYYSIHLSSGIKLLKFHHTVSSKLVIAWNKSKVLSPLESEFLQFTKKWFASL